MGLLNDGKVIPLDRAQQIENDIVILRRFFDCYQKFDAARVLYEGAGHYRGDKSNDTTRAYDDMQVAFRDAQVVVARIAGESP